MTYMDKTVNAETCWSLSGRVFRVKLAQEMESLHLRERENRGCSMKDLKIRVFLDESSI